MKMKKIGVLVLLAVMIAACSKGGNDATKSESVMYVDAGAGLRMRSSADTGAAVILTIPNGSQVAVLEIAEPQIEISGKTGRWTRVKYQDKEGWVFGGFLSQAKRGRDLAGSTYVETETAESCTPGTFAATTLIFETGFRVKGVKDVGDAHGNFRSEVSGTYDVNDSEESVVVAWVQKETQEGDVGYPIGPKKTSQMNESETFSFCECDGFEALCGRYARYIGRKPVDGIDKSTLIGRKFVCDADSNVSLTFISETKVRISSNECEGYMETLGDYSVAGSAIHLGPSTQESRFKLSKGALIPEQEFISCGQCRNSIFR
ncbi:MAG: SH3 domain-containing protein [Leptonema illini]|uniref:SH3 domain-containing protein n=1 Tax=Leptonema illini TaxID=183 RepID=A0A833H3A6_9LEPT|nr:MAG: SH3 domain-containing protein [Leptonema illini]